MECKLISRYSPLLVLFLASLVNAQTGTFLNSLFIKSYPFSYSSVTPCVGFDLADSDLQFGKWGECFFCLWVESRYTRYCLQQGGTRLCTVDVHIFSSSLESLSSSRGIDNNKAKWEKNSSFVVLMFASIITIHTQIDPHPQSHYHHKWSHDDNQPTE